jgi:proteasome lid subunit RPN8/RPN11
MKIQNDFKILIKTQIYNKMVNCVNKASPNEACGLVFGEIKEVEENGDFQYHYLPKKFNCIESSRKSTVAFLMNNIEELNALFYEAFSKYNLRLISIFHSHPGGNYPSGIDVDNMKYLDNCGNKAFKNQIWTIMDATNKEINGFIYFNNELVQIDVRLEN